jgi:catechol 2,3-dioxygenase-like lactoylglutathione lyase family enzyme
VVRAHARPPARHAPNADEAAWQLAGPAWLFLVREADRAGRALVTLLVDDLDARLAALAECGLSAATVEPVGNVGRSAAITDPDGNRITFAQLHRR